MLEENARSKLIPSGNVREFFQESLQTALSQQNISVADETVLYVVSVLDGFVRSDQFYTQTDDGMVRRPLAEFYFQALEAPCDEARNAALRRLGDVALFVAGLFGESLSRSLVDVDYYIAMGGNAYAYLSDRFRRTGQRTVFVHVFGELSTKFTDFVDALSEVGEMLSTQNDRDVLRVYELWLKTGSKRCGRVLREQGIQPVDTTWNARH